MKSSKTKCSECLYSKNKAVQEPCCKCSEIQYPWMKHESHFIPSDKNLVQVVQHE